MSIFTTKPIEQIKDEHLKAEQVGQGSGGELQRVLGAWQLVMLGVGAIIGTGIFVLTGQAAAANAGPAIVISMVLAGLTIVIAAGAAFVEPANWHPFIPQNTGTFGEYGWSGILRGAGVIFFAYIGFDAVSTSAQEARNPQRDMPRGILGSLAICTVLFVMVSGVMVGLVPYKTMLNQPAPLVLTIQAAADRAAGTSWERLMAVVRVLVTVGGLAALRSVMVV